MKTLAAGTLLPHHVRGGSLSWCTAVVAPLAIENWELGATATLIRAEAVVAKIVRGLLPVANLADVILRWLTPARIANLTHR